MILLDVQLPVRIVFFYLGNDSDCAFKAQTLPTIACSKSLQQLGFSFGQINFNSGETSLTLKNVSLTKAAEIFGSVKE